MREKEIEKLVEQIIEYMVSYLLEGFVNPNITKGLNISGARALNFNTALKIRFLLDREVRDFLRRLQTYLRRIRTEVSREKDLRKGEVRGHIDWRKTIQIWASSGFQDKTIFATSKPVRNYDIPENLILKKIVTILNDIMNDKEVRTEIERYYEWSQELRERRRYIHEVLKNVHFKRIMDEKKIEITSRMKTQVKKSRKKLYRESCKIFEKYQFVFLKHELSQLLKDTFIDPNNIEKTYELFCLFRVIETLEQAMGWQIKKLKEIARDRDETAVLAQNNYKINIFYNVTEPAGLEFFDRAEPKETKQALHEVTREYFGKERKVTTRRPDIIIELACDGVVRDYIVFEVKYTSDAEYIVEGIYQALHYLYDLKRKEGESYFFKKSLGKGYNAAVIAYELQLPSNVDKTNKLETENLKAKLFEFSDLRDYRALSAFFRKFFSRHGLTQECVRAV